MIEIEELYHSIWRSKSFEERFQRVSELFVAGRKILEAKINREYPELSDREKRIRIARLMYVDEPEISRFLDRAEVYR